MIKASGIQRVLDFIGCKWSLVAAAEAIFVGAFGRAGCGSHFIVEYPLQYMSTDQQLSYSAHPSSSSSFPSSSRALMQQADRRRPPANARSVHFPDDEANYSPPEGLGGPVPGARGYYPGGGPPQDEWNAGKITGGPYGGGSNYHQPPLNSNSGSNFAPQQQPPLGMQYGQNNNGINNGNFPPPYQQQQQQQPYPGMGGGAYGENHFGGGNYPMQQAGPYAGIAQQQQQQQGGGGGGFGTMSYRGGVQPMPMQTVPVQMRSHY